ncbi:hypothetical protein CAEBREN_30106 [Caenorhabditis brenneri]|uniref:Uncharacterized protein n=1 Tax=Caenorhabditis brenneri TaxID=135651 RepID=G0PKS2_CAEBE|nr:hypothetical protein CAEBREN_30106 [Caenorhabditis brenneri]
MSNAVSRGPGRGKPNQGKSSGARFQSFLPFQGFFPDHNAVPMDQQHQYVLPYVAQPNQGK